jgi:fatty acid desaturase
VFDELSEMFIVKVKLLVIAPTVLFFESAFSLATLMIFSYIVVLVYFLHHFDARTDDADQFVAPVE